MGKKVRAVYRAAGEPARIVLCEADLRRLARRMGGEIELREGEAEWHGRTVGFAAVVCRFGREVGMPGWEDGQGGLWYGPAVAFGLGDGELIGLDEDGAEAVRRFLDGERDGTEED